MSNFPLYDSLSSEVTNVDLTTLEKDELMKLLKNAHTIYAVGAFTPPLSKKI